MTKKKSNLLKKILLVFVVAAILIGVLFVLEKTNTINIYRTNNDPGTSYADTVGEIDYSPATTTDNEETEAKKADGTIEQVPDIPTNDTTIQITFISSGQDYNEGPLEVRTLLSGINNGVCDLTLSKDSATSSRSSNVILQNTYYVCEAFIIPYTELENGTWQIKLKVTSGDGRTNEATTSTSIN